MAQLLSNLPVKALVKFGKHSVGSEAAQPIIWRVADKNHSGYPSNSVTLITDKIIDLRAYDASESAILNGNMDYKLSNINQWLNSDASANNWYTASHSGDAVQSGTGDYYGTGYKERPGFLYNFTIEERLSILQTTVPYQAGTSTVSNTVARVFIPSAIEIIGNQYFSDGSSRFACFTTYDESKAALTNQAYTYSTAREKPDSLDKTWKYWTRSTIVDSHLVISSGGSSTYAEPRDGTVGVRPVLNLSATVKISDTPDSDGCYTLIPQSPPVISETNRDLGTKTDGFTQTYTVSDVDSATVTVKEYIDNVLLRSYVATLGATNTFNVTGKTWLALANGKHTMKIVVTDGFDEVTRTFTFTKSISSLVVQRTEPIASLYRPTNIIVTVVKNIPYNATMKVEACNNGFDAKPTWEDITDSVTSGLTHVFANKSSTSTQWGVNVRVTVDRNGSEGACYITEIGGNFE